MNDEPKPPPFSSIHSPNEPPGSNVLPALTPESEPKAAPVEPAPPEEAPKP